MSPFLKGALGFLGCAGICAAAYHIGKTVGREETLKEVEYEEKKRMTYIPVQQPVQEVKPETEQKEIIVAEEPVEVVELAPQTQTTVAEKVRKKHGLKNKIFGGTLGAVKNIFGDLDDKKLTVTTEGGDIVARISQKEGGS